MYTPIRSRLRRVAVGAIAKLVNVATDSFYGRVYYSNRWHPRYALLEDALGETVAYIKSDMRDAIIRNDAFEVLSYAVKHTRIDGLHLEFGVRSGSTINHVARLRPSWTLFGFDSFEGLPEAWSGYTLTKGAFAGESTPTVEPNVQLVKGWFDDTLPTFVAENQGPIAFVHVDSDIYSSAKTVLEQVGARLQTGSVIVFNEYFNYPNWKQHEYRAWQEYCASTGTTYDYLCWGLYEVAVRITGTGSVGDD